MNRLEDYLALHAQETPEKIAVVCNQQEPTVAGRREKQCSYEELYQRVCQRAEELTLSLSNTDSSLHSRASLAYPSPFTLHSSLPKMERELKAIIQQYMERMTEDRLLP